ncbi:MAG: FAD-dependent oxidoreductase [Chloroflexi bacterium]|nr:FAD-dependent oxidoreductase [Chloroflexota bacterium]
MSADERYDVVIVGGGHNGTTIAAYLAKCGLSVCIVEERPECGGAQENTEPIAGARLSPHAIANYGGAAPGWEQLELWKYGFRMDLHARHPEYRQQPTGFMTGEGMYQVTAEDGMGWAKIAGFLGSPMFTTDLLRATFWCPPHPPEVELTADNIPFMQVYKKHQPDVWTEELLRMTMFDFLDEYIKGEPFKALQCYVALVSGAHGHFEGQAIPAFCSAVMVTPPYIPRPVGPRGNIHGYYHSLLRCAIAHGAVVRTCCPVDEIIINNGTAVGVRLRDTAPRGEKRIWAKKAVISATDIRQTFLQLIGPSHIDAGFAQRIKDLSLKGGSLYVTHWLTRKQLKFRPKYATAMSGEGVFTGGPFIGGAGTRKEYFNHVAEVMGWKGRPRVPAKEGLFLWVGNENYDTTHPQCTRPGQQICGPFDTMVATPEYDPEGPDNLNKIKAEMDAYNLELAGVICENLDSDNIVKTFVNTPYDSEFRNTGLLGGSWYGVRPSRDEWWNTRPMPELARGRTQIDGLYLCHQSSTHPGGLCLMACGYNLMHTLIEDGIAEPGKWWYASPWYIPQQGKKSAKRP